MSEIEEKILENVIENGFSKSFVDDLRNNLEKISSEFLVDILMDQINLYIDYLLLFEFLPKVWNNNNNQSSNLLGFIGGLSHKVFYLTREYPLGKEPPAYLKREIETIHTYLCDFMLSCMEEIPFDSQYILGELNSFKQLFIKISNYPKFPPQITEMLLILGKIYLFFGKNSYQKIRNIDELALYLSRILIFWKLGSLNQEEAVSCFENASRIYKGEKNLTKLEEILALEIQNYQFLQLGINRSIVEITAKTFLDLIKAQ